MNSTKNLGLVRSLVLALVAASLSAGLASAQTYEGNFTLPFEARWGGVTLTPGDYSFSLESAASPYMVTLSQGVRKLGFIMATTASRTGSSGRSVLIVARNGHKATVTAMYIDGAGVTFLYFVPKAKRQFIAQAPELIQRLPISAAGK